MKTEERMSGSFKVQKAKRISTKDENGKKMAAPPKITTGTVFKDLYAMNKYRASCDVIGTSDLCMHRFPLETLEEFWERYAGKTKTKAEVEEEKKDPAKKFKNDPVAQALYYAYWKEGIPESWEEAQGAPVYFPTIAFHHSMVDAIRNYHVDSTKKKDQVTMKGTKGSFFCVPDWGAFTDIEYDELVLFEGSTINQNAIGKPRVAIGRSLFRGWRCRLNIEFSEVSGVTPELLFNLLIIAGETVGIGSWRRGCGGPFGCFRIENMCSKKM